MITGLYTPFASLSDDDLSRALAEIEARELSALASDGQRTLTIGNVSFEYASRAELARIKSQLIAAYNARAVANNRAAKPYRITHMMR